MCTLIQYAFFSICFNYTLRQSNFVLYEQQVQGGCNPRPQFKQEPIQAYNSSDYYPITDKYDRGHLVPNADYGCSTFIMGNVVPQLSGFNRGRWRIIESEIRNKYQGFTIVKGCKYQGRAASGIAVPEGCYWLVFNKNGQLIDNKYEDQFTQVSTKELPFWFRYVSSLLVSPQPQPTPEPPNVPNLPIQNKDVTPYFVIGLFLVCCIGIVYFLARRPIHVV